MVDLLKKHRRTRGQPRGGCPRWNPAGL